MNAPETMNAPVAAVALAPSVSPGRRIWLRFKQNRRGYWSLILFCILFGLSLIAEVISNDKPLVVRFDGAFYFPLVKHYPETVFGGDFASGATGRGRDDGGVAQGADRHWR